MLNDSLSINCVSIIEHIKVIDGMCSFVIKYVYFGKSINVTFCKSKLSIKKLTYIGLICVMGRLNKASAYTFFRNYVTEIYFILFL